MRHRDSLFTSDIGTEMYDDRHQLNNTGKQDGEKYNVITKHHEALQDSKTVVSLTEHYLWQ